MQTIPLLENIKTYILNPIITVLFASAVVVFIAGLFKYFQKPGDKTAYSYMLWGAVGMGIMISAWSLLWMVGNTVYTLVQ